MFKLLPVTLADHRAEYRLVTADGVDFDRELVDRYRVTVSCLDHGSPPLTASASLEVVVDDVNDHDPRLSQRHYVLHVPENSRPVAVIGTIAAEDLDIGPNGAVTYHLEPRDADSSEASVIQIDAETGVVTLEAGQTINRLSNAIHCMRQNTILLAACVCVHARVFADELYLENG